jgi:UDP-glucose 4-epimerase
LNQKTALITGAYGFIGRHVARAASKRGYLVRGMGHGGWGRDEWRQWGLSDWHSTDVTIESLLTYSGEPDVIFHCAGSGSVAFSMTHPYQDYQRTVATTLSVLEYLRINMPQTRLVIPSSAGVYGLAQKMPIAVDDFLNPVSPYGLHKKMAEDLCRSYAQHFGVRSASVRLFSVYGIGIRKQLIWDACQKMAAGNFNFAGTGRETRDWLHVEDAADLLLLAADHADESCPMVNGGAGVAVKIKDVVERIAERLDVPQRPVFSGAVRQGDPVHYQADVSEAFALGWRPTRDLHTEIDAYVDWYKGGAR